MKNYWWKIKATSNVFDLVGRFAGLLVSYRNPRRRVSDLARVHDHAHHHDRALTTVGCAVTVKHSPGHKSHATSPDDTAREFRKKFPEFRIIEISAAGINSNPIGDMICSYQLTSIESQTSVK